MVSGDESKTVTIKTTNEDLEGTAELRIIGSNLMGSTQVYNTYGFKCGVVEDCAETFYIRNEDLFAQNLPIRNVNGDIIGTVVYDNIYLGYLKKEG